MEQMTAKRILIYFLVFFSTHIAAQEYYGPLVNSKIINLYHPTFAISDNTNLTLSGVDQYTFGYHPVSGFALEQSAELTRNNFRTSATAGYAFSAKQPIAKYDIGIYRDQLSVKLSAQHCFYDWKADLGERQFGNSIRSVFSKRNSKSIFLLDKANLQFSFLPYNWLKLNSDISIARIKRQENRCNFSLFRRDKDFAPNTPYNNHMTTENINNRTVYDVSVNVAIVAENNETNNRSIDFRAIHSIKDSHLEGYGHTHISAIYKNLHRTSNSLFACEIECGTFFNANDLSFLHWQHYKGTDKMFGLSNELSGYEGFVTFKTYELSTNKWHAMAKTSIITQRHVIKVLEKAYISQELYARCAISGLDNRPYSEFGYGFGNILGQLRATCFVSFCGNDFRKVEFRMGADIK